MNMHKRPMIALLLSLPMLASAQVVVVNAQNGAALSKEQVEQLFTGKASSFPGGAAATPVDNAALREAFYKAATGKSGDQARAHWAKLEFTGKAKAPSELANGKAVVDFVAKNPGGIGYVDKAEVGAGVKAALSLQ